MGFTRVKDVVDAYALGQYWYSSFKKVPAIASTAFTWIDMSMAPGNPPANYYIGDQYTAKTFTATKGMYHGGNVAPYTKYLHKLSLCSVSANYTPGVFILCDYLMYYPLIDMDSTDLQVLDNTQASLPRYTDGSGVCAFIVATNPFAGGASFELTYTNSLGQKNRTTPPVITNVTTTIGTLVHAGVGSVSKTGPFMWLSPPDWGIRSVEAIQFASSNGGLAAIVLVKPLATIISRETTATVERDFFVDLPSAPIIYDGAYLNFLCAPTGNVSATQVIGDMSVVWG